MIAVVVALVAAGCAGGDEPSRETVAPQIAGTPTPTPSPTPTPAYPDGVRAESVNAFELARAHEAAVSERETTIRFQRTVRRPNGSTLSSYRLRATTTGDRLLVDVGGRVPGGVRPQLGRGNRTVWSNGSVVVTRQVSTDGSVDYRYREGQPAAAYSPLTTGTTAIHSLLVGQNLSVVRETEGGTAYVLAGDVRRPIDGLGTDTANGTLRALVTAEGVVRWIECRYETRIDGKAAVVTARFETGEATAPVDRPAWIDTAINESDGGYPGEYDALAGPATVTARAALSPAPEGRTPPAGGRTADPA